MPIVRFERAGDVGSIILAEPPFNRISTRLAADLTTAVHAAGESDIRALVVRADGPNFCMGGDLSEWPGKNKHWFRTYISEVNAAFHAIETLRVPTIAVIQGMAMGGGFELALSCDFIVAAEDARFICVEVTAGMIPLAGGLQRLAERLGRSRAVQMVLTPQPLPAPEAAALGLVASVAPSAELSVRALELAGRLASGPTQAYAAARTLLKVWGSGGVAAADAVMLDIGAGLFVSDDAAIGIQTRVASMTAGTQPGPAPFTGA